MRSQPNKEFCERVRLPYPAAEHRWHPQFFTQDALKETLTTMLAHDVHFAPINEAMECARDNDAKLERTAALVFDIQFSLRQANVFTKTLDVFNERNNARVSSSFVFYSNALTYDIDSSNAKFMMRFLEDEGHDVKVLQQTSGMEILSDITKNILPQGMVFGTTVNGVYEEACPNEFAAGDKKFAAFVIADHAFSADPLWHLDRLGALPEVQSNPHTVRDYYLSKRQPLLGAQGTFEAVPESRQHMGARGFRAQRHEISG